MRYILKYRSQVGILKSTGQGTSERRHGDGVVIVAVQVLSKSIKNRRNLCRKVGSILGYATISAHEISHRTSNVH